MSDEITRKVIDDIAFGMLSPQSIRKLSVVEIQTPDTYDEDGAPIIGGLITATFTNLFLVPVLYAWFKERKVKHS